MPALKAAGHAVRLQHAELLQHLTRALVVQAELRPGVALAASADARDLPEAVRTVGTCYVVPVVVVVVLLLLLIIIIMLLMI